MAIQPTAVIAVMLLASMRQTLGNTGDTQRPVRRTSVRTVLANKMDPQFWAARGRRSFDILKSPPKSYRDITRKQASEEEGPFWANRGRSVQFDLTPRQTDSEGPFWANRGRSLGDEGPFWANRGRSLDEDSLFDQFAEDDGPFWANRGRSINSAEEGPFWANRGRSISKTEEGGPFWANRGRREEEDEDERLRRNTLYVDEPGYIVTYPLRQPQTRRNIPSEYEQDTFYSVRGKKQDRLKRESGEFLPLEVTEGSWLLRNARSSKINRALEKLKDTQFWAARGKKLTNQNEKNQTQPTKASCQNKTVNNK